MSSKFRAHGRVTFEGQRFGLASFFLGWFPSIHALPLACDENTAPLSHEEKS
jgi:hypothetical protein